MRRLLLILTVTFLPVLAHAQLWSGVLTNSRFGGTGMTWANVGATISNSRTQCATTQCNTVSGGTVTAASINAALASMSANTYLLIPSGTYNISSGIYCNATNACNNLTIRGSGSNSTFLVWTGSAGGSGNCGGHDICFASSDTNYAGGPSNTATWSGGSATSTVTSGTYTQGGTYISLSSVSGLSVGHPLILDQIDSQTDPGSGSVYHGCEIYDSQGACYSGAAYNGYERGTGSLTTIRGQQQIVQVVSITGTGPYTVQITPGIYADNYATGNSPGAWWASNPVTGDAVENISLDHTNGGDGITFFNCFNCWVKGIRSITTSSGGTGWYHVGFAICNHCTVRDSYHYGYEGDDYGFANYIGSDNLWENNISQLPAEEYFSNSDCEGCVSTYNFSVNPFFGDSANWLSQSNYYHGVQLFALHEGNIGSGIYEDSFHGNHSLNVAYRNRWDGHEQNNGNATSSSTIAVRLNPGARYMNLIANVLGTPGYHTNYKAAYNSNCSMAYVSVIDAGSYCETSTIDSLVNTTAMYWGNWDNVTNVARWCGNSSDTGWSTTCGSASEIPTGLSHYSVTVPTAGDTGSALPASFVYASKPSWWPSGKAWPNIGPDVSGGNVGQCSGGTYDSSEALSSSQCPGGTFSANSLVVSNPAMDCYLNIMGGVVNGTGSALLFDSSTCFNGSNPPSTSPAPAPNLFAQVQK